MASYHPRCFQNCPQQENKLLWHIFRYWRYDGNDSYDSPDVGETCCKYCLPSVIVWFPSAVVTREFIVEVLGPLVVVSLGKKNDLCRDREEEIPIWWLTPFFAITVILYNISVCKFDNVTNGVIKSTSEGQNLTCKQLFEHWLMFAHALQCMSYLRSARPPSNTGRVHATIATLFEMIVMLISRGPDGGAAKDERSN